MRVLLLILLIQSSVVYCQKKGYKEDFNLSNLTKETMAIMKKLKIEIRSNLEKDDPLAIIVNPGKSAFNAEFISKTTAVPGDNIKLRYYLGPVIQVSATIDSIITQKKHPVLFDKLKAFSCIVHELNHYLQETYDTNYFRPESMQGFRKYISQPGEMESWAVEAYFFLKYYNRRKLKEIIKSKLGNREKMEWLINIFYNTVYPGRPQPVFK